MEKTNPNELNFWERLKAPTPNFFKRIMVSAFSIFFLCGSLAAGSMEYNGHVVAFELPDVLQIVCEKIAQYAIVVAAVCKFAVDGSALPINEIKPEEISSTI